jgi:hypothetical protein
MILLTRGDALSVDDFAKTLTTDDQVLAGIARCLAEGQQPDPPAAPS